MQVMKKLAIAASVVSVLGFASVSQAQVLSLSTPSVSGGNVTFTSVGNVNLQQTASINCQVVVSGTVVGSPGSASLSSVSGTITPAFPSCGWPIVYSIGTWSITAVNTAGEVDVHIEANTIVGDPCRGTVRLALEADHRTIYLDDVKLEADSGRADRRCTINGVLYADKNVYIL